MDTVPHFVDWLAGWLVGLVCFFFISCLCVSG